MKKVTNYLTIRTANQKRKYHNVSIFFCVPAILSYLETASLESPSNVMWQLSEMAETDMGGTSGGIYSLGLAAASQAIAKYAGSRILNALD